jgi:HK97 gp10 family phage protein
MSDIKVSFTGVKEIDAVLKGLPLQLNHKIMGQAHADAAKPLIDRAKLLAPEGPTGNLVDSIGVEKTGFAKATEIGQVAAGPRRGGRNKGYAGHLVEYGTKARFNKRGAYRGKMTAKPFMKPSFDQTKGEIENRIATSVGKKVLAYMRKTLK